MPAPGFRYPKGIYALQHKATKKIYLGLTRNFEKERLRIKGALNSTNDHHLPMEVQRFRPTSYDEWNFVKMEHAHPDADLRTLKNMLRAAIEKTSVKAPALLMNVGMPHAKDRPKAYIVTVRGQRYSLTALAKKYNLEPSTITHRYRMGIRGDQLINYTPRNRAHLQAQARAQKDTAKI